MPRPRNPVTLAEEKVPCAFCGAKPGERCVQRSGKPYPYSHAPRWEAATRVGYLPLAREGDAR